MCEGKSVNQSGGVNLNGWVKSFGELPALHRVFTRRPTNFVCEGRPECLRESASGISLVVSISAARARATAWNSQNKEAPRHNPILLACALLASSDTWKLKSPYCSG